MTNEDQFKDSLKKLVESKEFPFDESNWKQAQGLIHPSEKPGNRFFLYGISALILVLSGVFALYYFSGNSTTAVADKPTTPELTPAGEHKLVATLNERTAHAAALPAQPAAEHTSPSTHSTLSDAAKSPEEPVLQPNDPAGSFTPTSEKRTPAAAKTKQPAAVMVPEKTTGTVPTHNTAPVITTPAALHNATPVREKQTPVVSTDNTGIANTATPVHEKQTPAVSADNTTIANTATPVSETEAIPAKPIRTDVAVTAQQPEVTETTHTAETKTPAVETPAESVTAPVDEAYEATASHVTQAPATAKAFADKPDTSLRTEPDRNFATLPKKVLFSFEAGADYLTGWQNPGTKDANGFNPVAGFNYFNNITDKFAISIGAQYTSVSNLGYANHVSKVIRYNLGEESAVTVITPQKAHYIVAPLRLNYAINAKNTIGIGCNIAYLLTISSKVETYDQRINVKENDHVSHATGYNEGFKTFDTQLALFYRRKIYKNLSVNAEVMYGLTDIKDNTFFNSKVFERNKGLKLTLVYTIFK